MKLKTSVDEVMKTQQDQHSRTLVLVQSCRDPSPFLLGVRRGVAGVAGVSRGRSRRRGSPPERPLIKCMTSVACLQAAGNSRASINQLGLDGSEGLKKGWKAPGCFLFYRPTAHNVVKRAQEDPEPRVLPKTAGSGSVEGVPSELRLPVATDRVGSSCCVCGNQEPSRNCSRSFP